MNKRIFGCPLGPACVALAIFLLAGCNSTATSDSTASVSEFAILKDGVVLNRTKASFPLSYAKLITMIGHPTRTTEKQANTIYTWDALGILAYEPPGTGVIRSLSFCFKPESDPFDPKLPFASLTINGKTLNAESTADDLRAAGFQKGELYMQATIGAVKALCLFHEFAVPGFQEPGLITISCSPSK